MSTRSKRLNDTPALSDLEGATNPIETPGIMPPPGIIADVDTRVRYQRTIAPNEAGNYSDELRDLAAEEYNAEDLPEPIPQDPYTEFVNTFRKFVGYPLKVIRLPDPADKRMPGNTYNKPCFELTILSDMPFDPNNLIGMLQVINNNSGGVFRVFLTDEFGSHVPGARLDRLVIADPPKQYNQQQRPQSEDDYYRRLWERQQPPQQVLPTLSQKSDTELWLENAQRELFQKVMMRALDPPTPPTPDPLSALPADTRLALGLLQEGDVLKTAISRITDLAQAPDRIESSTWKDKLADAGLQLVTQNPQIVATVTDIASRLVMALATAFAPRQAQVVNEPIPVTPQYAPTTQRAPAPALPQNNPQAIPGLPETPQDDETDEDAEIDMMEEITKLLLSNKPLALDDPVIVGIREDYPVIFQAVMTGIANMPSASIIQYLCAKSDFCADMFQSSVTGPHLRNRLEELKRLLLEQPNAAPIPQEKVNETEPA